MPTLLEMKGIPQADTYVTMIINTLAEFPGVLTIGFLVAKVGRLLPMKLSLFVSGFALFCFAFARNQFSVTVCTSLAAMVLEACWSLFHTYVVEVYPTEIRASALAVNTTFVTLLALWIPTACSGLLQRGETVEVILCFGALAMVAGCVVAFALEVEPKDHDLEDTLQKERTN